jgi:hypothetical protein
VAVVAAAGAVAAAGEGAGPRPRRPQQRHPQKPADRPKLLLRRDDRPAADQEIRAAGVVAGDVAGDRRRVQRRLLSGRNTRRSAFSHRR